MVLMYFIVLEVMVIFHLYCVTVITVCSVNVDIWELYCIFCHGSQDEQLMEIQT